MKTKRKNREQNLVKAYEKIITRFVANHVTIDDMKTDSWYDLENKTLDSVAYSLGVSTQLVAAVVAATSPLKKWTENLPWAIDIIKHCCTSETANIWQGLHTSLGKALWLCWNYNNDTLTEDLIKQELGEKTYPFYDNLYRPEKSKLFTLDVWMIRVAAQNWIDATNNLTNAKFNGIKLDTARIRAMRQAYYNVYDALQLDKNGVMVHNLQAAIWLKIKEAIVASQWFNDFESVARFVSPNGKVNAHKVA